MFSNAIGLLATYSPFAFLDRYFPEEIRGRHFAGLNAVQWVEFAVIVAIGFAAGIILQALLLKIGHQIISRTKIGWDDDFIKLLPGPLRLFLSVFVISLLLPLVELSEEAEGYFHPILSCFLIGALIWFLLRFLEFGAQYVEKHFTKGEEPGSNHARAIHTQVTVVRVILRVIIVLAGLAMMLLQFDVAASLGRSLLASAGVAGIVMAFAANKTLGNLFAGLQIAITQPIKIGDVVIVEGEWGTVEEIKFTFVVVKIWDLRRLVVPVSYFLDKTFENWTLNSEELLGTVYLYTDYTVPMSEIREELKRVLENHPDWDKKTSGVIVTALKETVAEVRILVSAEDSSKIWNLRCDVREKMLTWLQSRGKSYLPTYRLAGSGVGGNGASENVNRQSQ